MGTTQKPTASKAVAVADADVVVAEMLSVEKSPVERARLFSISEALTQGRAVRRAGQILAATEWGRKLSEEGQTAFARYCVALGADPLRHVDILGGRVFTNGTYYRDVIAANPHFHHRDPLLWIHDDPRLTKCALCGEGFLADPAHGHEMEEVTTANRERTIERIKRAGLRVTYNCDEDSISICLLTLHYDDGRGPFIGIGEVHSRKTADNKDADPVGIQAPRATAETRAWREAGEQAEAVWFRTHKRVIDELANDVQVAHDTDKVRREAPPTDVIETPALEIHPIGEVAPAAVATAEATSAVEEPKRTQHAPSAICSTEGWHDMADCGYVKGK